MLAFVEDVTSDGLGFAATGTLVQVGARRCAGAAGGRRRGTTSRSARRAPTPSIACCRAPTRSCTSASLAGQDSVGVALVPNRLNRHTFWCGQSGSGKTYALGVLLERILVTTRLPMVVFDPNSDFVRLHEQAVEAGARTRHARCRSVRSSILRPDDPELTAARALHRADARAPRPRCCASTRWSTGRSTTRSCASSPASSTPSTPDRSCRYLRSLGDPDAEALAQRIENLGVVEWTRTWAFGAAPATEVIARRPAATVLDLGGYERPEEQLDRRPRRPRRPLGPTRPSVGPCSSSSTRRTTCARPTPRPRSGSRCATG